MIRLIVIPLCIWLLPVIHGLYGQDLIQGRMVDPNRYIMMKGSPFLFDDWVLVNIISSSGKPLENVPINFNGYTQNFESIVDGKILEVELGYFIAMQLITPDSNCGKQSFIKLQHPLMSNKYPLFIYNGFKHRLAKDFSVTIVENKIETPGKTEKFRSFKSNTGYFFMKNAEWVSLKLTEKDVLQKLNHPKAAGYIKQNNINVTTEAGLCQLLSWLETQ